ncbi:hypothetical protein M8C21_007093 [Ambrosia artemisiifolia]|uniref:Uncharacterized protein n=1 Tax=Ambrosia artemisiifolia TaxID=4212 RepID=A0AAD5GMC7_AMBAR|nr:hypothetical protein M8C21_007093 [Ambrosia artemisiifolia]
MIPRVGELCVLQTMLRIKIGSYNSVDTRSQVMVHPLVNLCRDPNIHGILGVGWGVEDVGDDDSSHVTFRWIPARYVDVKGINMCPFTVGGVTAASTAKYWWSTMINNLYTCSQLRAYYVTQVQKQLNTH